MAVIQITVLTMPNTKIEYAPTKRASQAVMPVKWIAKKRLLNKIKPYGFTLFIKYSRLPASYDKAIRRGKYE